MNLSPEQQQAIASWVAAGDNLSALQQKLAEQFKISMTYRDVRFLIDDLNLVLKDTAPKVDATDISKAPPPPPAPSATQRTAPPEKKGFLDKAKKKLGLAREQPGPTPVEDDLGDDDLPEDDFEDLPPSGPSKVAVSVDKVSLIPGALASGSVTFSDGVTGQWVVDQYGRPGFTKISKEGYRPSPADAQGFMKELSTALQKLGY